MSGVVGVVVSVFLAFLIEYVAKARVLREEAVLMLFRCGGFDAVATDDARSIRYLRGLGVPFAVPAVLVVVLRPGGVLERSWRMETWGRQIASCCFEVMALWRMDAAAVLAQGLVGLYPLLPLMRWERAEPAEILTRSQDLILESITPREACADAYVALRVLSGIAYPPELVRSLLQRRELMLESPVYRDILEEGQEIGLQQGLRENILTALEVRLGEVPQELAARVRQVEGRERLEQLLRRAVVAESLEAFARELGG